MDLAMGDPIHLLVAPAAKVNFSDLPRLLGWLKSMGVANIYDVSFGADISTWAYLKARQELSLSSVIAQPCPSVVNFCERYMPELLPSLAPIQSPLICMAIYLRLEKQLEGEAFCRCHNAFLVSLSHVQRFTAASVSLPGVEAPVSKYRKQAFFAALAEYQGSMI